MKRLKNLVSEDISKKLPENGENDEKPFFHQVLRSRKRQLKNFYTHEFDCPSATYLFKWHGRYTGINDLLSIFENFCSILYADDTTLCCRSSSLKALASKCNEDLKLFNYWTIANRLSVNFDKTIYMLVSNRISHIIELFIGDHSLKRSTNVQYLGVQLDESLTFNAQIMKVCKKVSRSIGVLLQSNASEIVTLYCTKN